VLTSRALVEPKSPHDGFVKYTFSNLENAAVALRSVLPEGLSRRINWHSLRLESGRHIDLLLSDTHTDLLFSTSIAGQRALLYVLFEHQSTWASPSWSNRPTASWLEFLRKESA
jgi:predicted transposase YdaD